MRRSVILLPLLLLSLALAGAPKLWAGATNVGATPSGVRIVAYYFHVTMRCVTCRTIEQYSREAIEQGFREELTKGLIEWRPVNVQLAENRHYIQDYRLVTRSLVLVKMNGGKQIEWRNLDKVWDLVGKKSDFLNYVRTNVRTFLGRS